MNSLNTALAGFVDGFKKNIEAVALLSAIPVGKILGKVISSMIFIVNDGKFAEYETYADSIFEQQKLSEAKKSPETENSNISF